MALFPCDNHLARYRGPSSAAYPAILGRGTNVRRKLRLCSDCLTAKIDECPVTMQLLVLDTAQDLTMREGHGCIMNDKQEAKFAFFLTAYPRGEEERSYYALVCDSHALALQEHWGLENG